MHGQWMPVIANNVDQGRAVHRPITANSGLNFNLLFLFMYLRIRVLFMTSKGLSLLAFELKLA